MDQNSKVIPYAELVNEEISILDISKKVIGFYKKLILLNSAFNHVSIVSEKKSIYDLITVDSEDAIKQLADEILLQNREDILKIDKVEAPDVNYIRVGNYINFSLGVQLANQPLLTLSFSFIKSDHVKSKVGTLVANKKCFDNMKDCIFFLETIKSSFNIEYASLKLSFFDRIISKEFRKFKAPLGLITFFSEKVYKEMPRYLPGITCNEVDEGIILILEKPNIFDKKASIKSSVLKLLELMLLIEKDYPAYSKKFTPPLA